MKYPSLSFVRSPVRVLALLAVPSALAAAACYDPGQAPLALATPPVAEPPPPEPAVAEAKPTIAKLVARTHKQMRDAVNEHDGERFASSLTEDASMAFAGVPEAHGRADVAAGLASAFDVISNLKVADARIFEKKGVQIVEYVVTGTMTGDYQGIKATKKDLGERRLAIATYDDDGQLTRWREYADTPGLLAQMKGAKDAPGIPPLPGKRPEAHVGDPPPVAPDAGKSQDEDDKDESKIDPGWIQTLNDAYSKDDPKAVAALEADKADATLYFLGGKTVSGKALADFHAEFARAFPGAKFTVDDAWIVDDFVIAQRTLTGTQKARFGGVAPSRRPVTLHLAEVYAVGDDGKIQHTWSYADLGELVPPPAAKPGPVKQARR